MSGRFLPWVPYQILRRQEAGRRFLTKAKRDDVDFYSTT